MSAAATRIGLVGCGAVVHTMYSTVLRGRADYDVALVHDISEGQARSAARLFGAQVASLGDLVDGSEVIIVTTPPSTHAEVVRACLASGRRILCEKPFITDSREAAAVTAEAVASETALYVGHFRRTFPQLELAQRLIAQGVIGTVTGFSASEGGRFTWQAVSGYTVKDPHGGVLWDTGSHTLDMALFAAGIDLWPELQVADVSVQRDREEPSHDLAARFVLRNEDHAVDGKVHISRRRTMPNLVRIVGERGEVGFVAGMDDRIRLTTPRGSTVLRTDRSHVDLLECFDLQVRRVVSGDGAEVFAAERFVSQVRLMEALSNG
jgi:predicted dehydrogenase